MANESLSAKPWSKTKELGDPGRKALSDAGLKGFSANPGREHAEPRLLKGLFAEFFLESRQFFRLVQLLLRIPAVLGEEIADIKGDFLAVDVITIDPIRRDDRRAIATTYLAILHPNFRIGIDIVTEHSTHVVLV